MKPQVCHRCSFLFLFLSLFVHIDLGHANNNNYNVYNYDMATPQFTPDGRLLQVEYASTAAELSSPVVAFQHNKETLVLIALRTSNTQSRIVQLDNDICIAMSGVLADSIALLQVVMKRTAQHMQQYKKPLSLFHVASAVADACQRHSFGGGIRPYGSTMLICGFTGGSKATLYQTDPAGSIHEAPMEISDDSSTSQIRWIVGGSGSTQRQLRKRLASSLSRQRKRDKASIIDSISIVARALIKEGQENSTVPPSLEVMVLSSTLGCHRLTSEQLNAIQKRI